MEGNSWACCLWQPVSTTSEAVTRQCHCGSAGCGRLRQAVSALREGGQFAADDLLHGSPDIQWLQELVDSRPTLSGNMLCCLSCPAVLLHLLFSTFLWMPSYYSKLWDNTDSAIVPVVNGTKLDKFGLMKGEAPCSDQGWCRHFCTAN